VCSPQGAETKYLRLRTPVEFGSRFDDWDANMETDSGSHFHHNAVVPSADSIADCARLLIDAFSGARRPGEHLRKRVAFERCLLGANLVRHDS
jgi:hypothetical protein